MSLLPTVARAVAASGFDHEVLACDPDLADTAEFCRHYGVEPIDSANTILIASRRPPGRHAACVVLATTRLDANNRVRHEMGVKKLSFADVESTADITGMEIGGVTPFGLPATLPVLVDSAVMTRERIVLGGGNRVSKLRISPHALLSVSNLRVVENLAFDG